MFDVFSKLSKNYSNVIIDKINSDMNRYGLIENLSENDIFTLISCVVEHCRRGIFKNNKWFLRKRISHYLRDINKTCRRPCIEQYLTLPGTCYWIEKLINSFLDEKISLNINNICAALVIDGFISSRTVRRIVNDIKNEYKKSTISFTTTPLSIHMENIREVNGLFHQNFSIIYKIKSYYIARGLISKFYNVLLRTSLNIASLMELGAHSYREQGNIDGGYRYALRMFRELKIETLIKYTIQFLNLEPDIIGYNEYINIVNLNVSNICNNIVRIYTGILSSLNLYSY